jgi:hypothetical protein
MITTTITITIIIIIHRSCPLMRIVLVAAVLAAAAALCVGGLVACRHLLLQETPPHSHPLPLLSSLQPPRLVVLTVDKCFGVELFGSKEEMELKIKC